MDPYILALTLLGIITLGMAWFPSFTQRTHISYSVVYILFGVILYYFLYAHLPKPDPIGKQQFTLHLTEMVVIIALMGNGLKIDQPFSFKGWTIPFRLVSITMILSIALVALLAIFLLGWDPATAILLGAVLAPTDPVMASDVQVDPPMMGKKDNVRFSLTAEAGMNDGMAFPFTWLAIILAVNGVGNWEALGTWLIRDVVYKILAGVFAGIALGRLMAILVFYLPEKKNFIVIKDGFVAVAATFLVYGCTELIYGYGFVAVFVSALTLRNYELNHKYHKKLHDFTDQIERILLSIILILLGGMIVQGILQPLNWSMVLLGVLVIFLVRPLTSWVALVGLQLKRKEQLTISFFGIRGIGSFFYLSFAASHFPFPYLKELWAIVSLTVLISITVHGVTATRAIKKLEKDSS